VPTWGELLKELGGLQKQHAVNNQAFGGQSPFDVLRRKYLAALSAHTGRATIVYATAWFENKDVGGDALQIDLSDLQGFMETVSNVSERELDLILHSPGGSAEAAESIVEYLRTRFDHIRVIVPIAAMSAATMVALGADEIVMGAHSQLGPIDPQFTVFTPEGPRSAPAQAIKDQFDSAKEECKTDPGAISAWLPILRSYGPGLIAQCDHQRALAEELVARWLEKYMLSGDGDPAGSAAAAARWFSDFTAFKSHGRRVSRDDARRQKINVTNLEQDDAFQDAVLSVHHAVAHTLSGTPTTKLIENHAGRAFIQMQQTFFGLSGQPSPASVPTPLAQPQLPAGNLNRAQRRGGTKKKRR
jgi:hypothetical protein